MKCRGTIPDNHVEIILDSFGKCETEIIRSVLTSGLKNSKQERIWIIKEKM